MGQTEKAAEEGNSQFAQFHAAYPRVTGWASWVKMRQCLGPRSHPEGAGPGEGRAKEAEGQAPGARQRAEGAGRAAPGEPRSTVSRCGLSTARCPRVAPGPHLPRLGNTRRRRQDAPGTPWCRLRRRPARLPHRHGPPAGPPRSAPRGPAGGAAPQNPLPHRLRFPASAPVWALRYLCVLYAKAVHKQRSGKWWKTCVAIHTRTFLPSKRMAHSNTDTVPREFFFTSYLAVFWYVFYFKQLYGTGPLALSKVKYYDEGAECSRAALRCLGGGTGETLKDQNMKAHLGNRNKLQEMGAREHLPCGCTFHWRITACFLARGHCRLVKGGHSSAMAWGGQKVFTGQGSLAQIVLRKWVVWIIWMIQAKQSLASKLLSYYLYKKSLGQDRMCW